jgi:hypothetical protein
MNSFQFTRSDRLLGAPKDTEEHEGKAGQVIHGRPGPSADHRGTRKTRGNTRFLALRLGMITAGYRDRGQVTEKAQKTKATADSSPCGSE